MAYWAMNLGRKIAQIQAKKRMAEATAEMLQGVHAGRRIANGSIYFTSAVSNDALRCPLTPEQLRIIEKCDHIERYNVKCEPIEASLPAKRGYVYMTMSIDFLGYEKGIEHRIEMEDVYILLLYQRTGGYKIQEIKRTDSYGHEVRQWNKQWNREHLLSNLCIFAVLILIMLAMLGVLPVPK